MQGSEIALIVVTIVAVVLGGFLKHFVNLLHQTGELLTRAAEAFEDGKITKKEFIDILKEAQDVAEAWTKIIALVLKKPAR